MKIHEADVKKLGSAFVGLGLIAYGVQQFIIGDFRPEIVPPFPAWLHRFSIFPYVSGAFLLLAGMAILGAFSTATNLKWRLCVGLGFFFLFLILFCHLPYLIFIFPHKLYHVGVWSNVLKEVAFSGAAFVVAATIPPMRNEGRLQRRWANALLQTVGRTLFCITIFMFGYSHFLYKEFMAPMIPRAFGYPIFWTCFTGGALMLSALAITLNLWRKWAAVLLSVMLFSWVFLVHIPGAIAHPREGNGNSIVSAFDALLFCGTALVIGMVSGKSTRQPFRIPEPL